VVGTRRRSSPGGVVIALAYAAKEAPVQAGAGAGSGSGSSWEGPPSRAYTEPSGYDGDRVHIHRSPDL
jgi:hypothetical protein